MSADTDARPTQHEADEYLRMLRPADDWADDRLPSGDDRELNVLHSLMQVDDDLDATAKLPVIDMDSLPPEVRDNLGKIDEDAADEQQIAAA